MNETIQQWYHAHEQAVADLKQCIWEHPETAFQEYYACAKTSEFLAQQGFQDLEVFNAEGKDAPPNTVIARWGSGSPVVGILGEFDALPALGQKLTADRSPVEGPGHGCGHCLLAAASASAASAIKEVMIAEHLPGTLVYIGCPAEEVLAGKPVLAKRGCFDELDVAYVWHPSASPLDFNSACEMSATTNIVFSFQGKTAHASFAWQGRSAQDAAELMNIGVQYLREHVTEDCRMHNAYRQMGAAPNIVPDKASVYYFLRSKECNNDDLVRRVQLIAEGAAKMTETTVSWAVEAGCHGYRPNPVLNKYAYVAASKVPPIPYSEEDYAFARALVQNITGAPTPLSPDELLPAGISEPTHTEHYMASSTDVGDVAMICPTIQLSGYGVPCGLSLHHWGMVAASGSGIGLKAALQGGKVLAQLAYDTFTQPQIVQEAWAAFHEEHCEKYTPKI